jgi:hypothetical protein
VWEGAGWAKGEGRVGPLRPLDVIKFVAFSAKAQAHCWSHQGGRTLLDLKKGSGMCDARTNVPFHLSSLRYFTGRALQKARNLGRRAS